MMEKESFISLVLPESVLGDNLLTYFERILLIDILSLCNKNGYCWPTNVLKKKIISIQRNINTSIQNNFNHDNKYNKKKKIIIK